MRQRYALETVGTLIVTTTPRADISPVIAIEVVRKLEYLKLLRHIEAVHDLKGPHTDLWARAQTFLNMTSDSPNDPGRQKLVAITIYDILEVKTLGLFRRTPLAVKRHSMHFKVFKITSVEFTSPFDAKVQISD